MFLQGWGPAAAGPLGQHGCPLRIKKFFWGGWKFDVLAFFYYGRLKRSKFSAQQFLNPMMGLECQCNCKPAVNRQPGYRGENS